MLQRELSYHVPYARLRRLGRSAGRKAYPTLHRLIWAFLAMVMAAVVSLSIFRDPLDRSLARAGLPITSNLLLLVIFVLLFTGLLWIRRYRVREVKRRASFDQLIRLRQDDGGLHIMTDEIEYYVKWPGLSQMLLEPDGIVVSHGNIFFLVPDQAFADSDERLAFIRDVYGRLNEAARARSERHLRLAIGA
jgi:hypothetical protein